ncbi:MAG TPA: prepilin peptidase [Candidatus Elarobacter sp.]|jgi:prepilin signal peptidase PulO-like enzyme (type II secretory pathway)
MTSIAFGALYALLFAGAAFAGVLIAEAWCAGRRPYADGPASVRVGRMPFAVAGGCIGLALASQAAPPPAVALLVVVVLALAGCAAADFSCGALPDAFTLPPLALIIAVGAFAHDWAPAFGSAFIAAPFALAALLSRGRGMGWGDVKLAALGGALLGGADATLAYLLAAVAAYVVARRTAGVRRPIAFGPYLAASIAAMLPLVRTF